MLSAGSAAHESSALELGHGSRAAKNSTRMGRRPWKLLISRNAQAFFLALLLAFSEFAFHTKRVAVWTWQPGLQTVAPAAASQEAGLITASPTPAAASTFAIFEDNNQSGWLTAWLSGPDDRAQVSSNDGADGAAGGGGGGEDDGTDGWGGVAVPLAFAFPAGKAILQDDVASAVQLQCALLLSSALASGMQAADVMLLSLYTPGEAAGPLSVPLAAAVEEIWRPPPAAFVNVALDLSIMTELGADGDELILQLDNVPVNTTVSILTSAAAALLDKPDAELGLLNPNDSVVNPATVLSSLGEVDQCNCFRAVPRDIVGGDGDEERPTHSCRRVSTEQPAVVDRGSKQPAHKRFIWVCLCFVLDNAYLLLYIIKIMPAACTCGHGGRT